MSQEDGHVDFEKRLFAAADMEGKERISCVRAVLLDPVAAEAIAHLDNDGGDYRMGVAIDYHISGAAWTAPEIRMVKHWDPLLSELMTDDMHDAAVKAMS